MTSLAETYLSCKTLMANKLNSKGITAASADDGLTTLINYIDDIAPSSSTNDLILYADKNIAQIGDTVTLSALVIEDRKAVVGGIVTFCDKLQSFSPTTRNFEVSSEEWRLTLANSSNFIVIGDNSNYLFIGKQNGGYVISNDMEDAITGQVNLNGDSIYFDGNQTLYSENDTYDISTIITIATWNSSHFSVGSQTSLSDVTIDIILGSATTNINGIAIYTYTCTGEKNVTITAETTLNGILLSETYNIIDALFVDKGDNNDWYNPSHKLTRVVNNDGSVTLTNNSGSLGFYLANQIGTSKTNYEDVSEWKLGVCVEFMLVSTSVNTNQIQIYNLSKDINSNRAFRTIGATTNTFVQIFINQNGTVEYKVNGETVTATNQEDDFEIGIRVGNNSSVTYKDFTIYNIN